MGQKVHPYGFRVGIIYKWKSRWFSKKAGFADPREKLSILFYNEKIKIPKELQHAIEKNTYLISLWEDDIF